MTLQEIADELGLTVNQVAWAEKSALQKLRRSPRTRKFAEALRDRVWLEPRVIGPAGGILQQSESQFFADFLPGSQAPEAR